jgi:hypothetical protein
MELVISIFACVLVSIFIGIQWVNGIDYMHKNHPDYKGEDLFDEDLTCLLYTSDAADDGRHV